MGIEKAAGRFNTWMEFVRNWREIGEPWGITPRAVASALIGAVVWVAAMIYQSVPWYILAPVALLFTGTLLFFCAGIAKARAVQGVRKISLGAVADACERFEERYWSFIESHGTELKAIADIRSRWPSTSDPDPHEIWNKERQAEDALMIKMKARLGSDVAALMAMFTTLEIDRESDFRSLHWSDSQARYYGAIGKLLRQGLLEEARKLKRHDIFF